MKKNDNVQMYKLFIKIVAIGLCGGLFVALLLLFCLYFHFIDLHINDIVSFFNVTYRWLAYSLYIIMFMVVSLFISGIYYVTLKKQKSWVPAAMFGIVLWGIGYVFIPMISTNLNSLRVFSTETHVTTLCIAIMYGTFIGYSISFHYNMYSEQKAEEKV